MAYFYQHIKGLTSRRTNWIIDATKIDDTTTGAMITPELRYTKQNANEQNLGYLITSNMSNGTINNAFTFNNNLYFKTSNTDSGVIIPSTYTQNDQTFGNLRLSGPQGNSAILDINKHQFKMEGLSTTQIVFKGVNTSTGITGSGASTIAPIENLPITLYIHGSGNYGFGLGVFSDNSDVYSSSSDVANTKMYANVPFYLHNYLRIRGSGSYIESDGCIKSRSYVEATYFNATSDKRAKTGINKSTFSALNIIKSLPIYNFKYKSDGSNSIGIIAQEALDVNAGNFNLVVNPQASGENGNYMSVKESKLVYIAWKAIQEQQEIIDKQSKEIEELKQLVKTLIEK